MRVRMGRSVFRSIVVLCGAMLFWLVLVMWALDAPQTLLQNYGVKNRFETILSDVVVIRRHETEKDKRTDAIDGGLNVNVKDDKPGDMQKSVSADNKDDQKYVDINKGAGKSDKTAEEQQQGNNKDIENTNKDGRKENVEGNPPNNMESDAKMKNSEANSANDKNSDNMEHEAENSMNQKWKDPKGDLPDEKTPTNDINGNKDEQNEGSHRNWQGKPNENQNNRQNNDMAKKINSNDVKWQSNRQQESNTQSQQNPAQHSKKLITLSPKGKVQIRRSEVDRYGSQHVPLTFLSKLHTTIKFLPNYRNPCWYQRSSKKDERQPVLQCLPYFYVPGVAKCGTTNLYDILQKHHQVAPPNFKEMYYLLTGKKMDPSFFSEATDTIFSTINFTSPQNTSWYHPIVTYEATPAALYTLPAKVVQDNRTSGDKFFLKADLIKQFLPSPKIIVILRDPVSRTLSDYNHFVHVSLGHFHYFLIHSIKHWDSCMAKHKDRRYCAYLMVDRTEYAPLGMSMYDVFLSDWIERFGRQNLHVVTLEDMKEDPVVVLAGIFNFLELEPMKQDLIDELRSNKPPALSPHQKRYKHYGRAMMNETHDLLTEFYRPHLQKLSDLLGDKKWMWGH